MAFKQCEIEQLLADTGRRCCLCDRLHGVQVHHIVPVEGGGSDHVDNAIPLCPNCHSDVHLQSAHGVATKKYTVAELKLHRKRQISAVKRQQGFVKEFAETDWHKISDGYEITIANSEHGVNNPSTEFQMNNGAYWSVVLVETGTDHDGNVIIRADRRFAGRCLVK